MGEGDAVHVSGRPEHDVTVAVVSRAMLGERALVPDLLAVEALPHKVREWAEQRVA